MPCPAPMLGYLFAIRLVLRAAVILLALRNEGSGVARAFALPAFFAGARTQSKDLSWIENVVVAQIEERFFDSMSRRFAQNQKRGTLRSE